MILGKVVRKLSTIIELHEEEMISEEEESDDSGLSMHDLRLQQLLECEDLEIKNFDKKLKKGMWQDQIVSCSFCNNILWPILYVCSSIMHTLPINIHPNGIYS